MNCGRMHVHQSRRIATWDSGARRGRAHRWYGKREISSLQFCKAARSPPISRTPVTPLAINSGSKTSFDHSG
jgi:hypothetical protein